MKNSTLINTILNALIFSMTALGSAQASADTYVPRAKRSTIEAPSEDGVGAPLHSMYNGFRVGAIAITGGVSEAMKERGMEWPMTTVLGVETVQRIRASQKLHFIVVGNLLAGGFDQNFFFVNANAAVGLDINEAIQFGMGVNLTPGSESGLSHAVYFASYSYPLDKGVFMPITVTAVPDKDNHHRFGLSIGFNWKS